MFNFKVVSIKSISSSRIERYERSAHASESSPDMKRVEESDAGRVEEVLLELDYGDIFMQVGNVAGQVALPPDNHVLLVINDRKMMGILKVGDTMQMKLRE